MAGVSKYLAEKWLEDEFTNGTTYLALFKSNPGKEGTGDEVDEAGYSRKEISFSAPYEENDKFNVKVDTVAFFDEAEENWGEVTHGAVYDSETGGELLWYGPLENPRYVLDGDQVVVREDEIVVSLD